MSFDCLLRYMYPVYVTTGWLAEINMPGYWTNIGSQSEIRTKRPTNLIYFWSHPYRQLSQCSVSSSFYPVVEINR